MRVRAHPPFALGRRCEHVVARRSVLVEQLLRAVRPQPGFQLGQLLGLLAQLRERNLVRRRRALARTGPALGCAQHDHRPLRALAVTLVTGATADVGDRVERVVDGCRHAAMHLDRLIALDEDRPVPVALQQGRELIARDARQHRRVGDLVAVEVQDRQHRAVADGVEELVRVPARRQRAGLGLAVADDAHDDQIRVVERRAVGVGQRIAELAALVDRPGRLGRDMARDPAGERELAEQSPHALLVARDVRVDLGVSPLEPRAGHHRGAAMTRAGDEDRVDVALADRTVDVDVEEVQPGGRAPVPEQPRLDVLRPQRLAQQRVVEQVDLADGQVVRRAPPGVDRLELGVGEGGRTAWAPRSCRAGSQAGAARAARRCRRTSLRWVGSSASSSTQRS